MFDLNDVRGNVAWQCLANTPVSHPEYSYFRSFKNKIWMKTSKKKGSGLILKTEALVRRTCLFDLRACVGETSNDFVFKTKKYVSGIL